MNFRLTPEKNGCPYFFPYSVSEISSKALVFQDWVSPPSYSTSLETFRNLKLESSSTGFQVTQVTAHSPTGMHGLKLAFGDAGFLTVAPRCRFWTAATQCFGDPHLPSPIEAGFSERPFTRPQRLSVTGPPRWGRSSRSIPSKPR